MTLLEQGRILNEIVDESYEVQSMSYNVAYIGQVEGSKFWHLTGDRGGGANFAEAWRYATGEGVLVGIVDEGVNRLHGDLAWAYDCDADYDPRDAADAMDALCDTAAETHGTLVAGMISGDLANAIGTVGGAQGADFSATFMRYGEAFRMSELADIIAHQSAYDVSNNSWSFTAAFADNFANQSFMAAAAALADGAAEGRDGLGTVFVFSAGNGRVVRNGANVGDDSGFHSFQSSRFAIAVGSHDLNGVASGFSSPGANVLLTAPGSGVWTTSGSAAGDTGGAYVSGTSFSAPMVSAAVALMLEANPELGFRDVQEILALSAVSRTGAGVAENGAQNVNGGGLMFDRHGGFGRLDAAAAVNLARNWDAQSTAANESRLDLAFSPPVSPDKSFAAFDAELLSPDGRGFSIDHVELEIDLYDRGLKNLTITLISPDGTRTAIAEQMTSIGSRTSLEYTFTSVETWGEDAFGTWRVEFAHKSAPTTFLLYDAKLRVHGDWDSADDSYYVTGSFATLAALDPDRATFRDADGGVDTLNFAAAKSAAVVDLSGETRTVQAGVAIRLAGDFENVVGTVFDDRLTGSSAANRLVGDDGADRLSGRDGDDALIGGLGDDTLSGGQGGDLIDGGAGHDTVALDGAFSDYAISWDGTAFRVTDALGSVDVVRAIEAFSFGGRLVDVSLAPDAVVDAAPTIVAVATSPAGAAAGKTIANDAAAGAVVAAVAAHDPNLAAGDALSFSLVTGDGGPFDGPFALEVGADGVVSVVYTGAGVAGDYAFLVRVTDLAGHSATEAVSVSIVDPNDAPIGLALEASTVIEAQAGAVVGRLTAVDPDGGAPVFTVDDGRFEVAQTPDGGVVLKLKAGIALDHEAASSAAVTVTATDRFGAAVSRTFDIAVLDVDEAPVAGGPRVVAVEAGAGETALDLAPLVDPEGRTVLYTLDGLPAGGALTLDGRAVAAGAVLTAAELTRLAFTAPDAEGLLTLSLTAGDGVNAVPFTVAITVSAAASRILVGCEDGDRLNGAAGDDALDGRAGGDTLNGGAGADRLDGGAGDDAMAGGRGDDVYLVDRQGDLVREVAGGGVDEVRTVVTLALADHVETLTLAGSATINGAGNELANLITGNDAANVLSGKGGADTLVGAGGDDRYLVDAAGDVVVETAGGGRDLIQSSVTLTVADHVENAVLVGGRAINCAGNDLANVITGNDAANALSGKGGADTLIGGGGDDRYVLDQAGDRVVESAGGGDDLVQSYVTHTLAAHVERLELVGGRAIDGVGNALANRIVGNAADNRLAGGAGNDTLAGGGGFDVFVFSGVNWGADEIVDFADGVDRIDLRGTRLGFGDLSISYDQDGANVASSYGSIHLAGVSSGLTSADFLF